MQHHVPRTGAPAASIRPSKRHPQTDTTALADRIVNAARQEWERSHGEDASGPPHADPGDPPRSAELLRSDPATFVDRLPPHLRIVLRALALQVRAAESAPVKSRGPSQRVVAHSR